MGVSTHGWREGHEHQKGGREGGGQKHLQVGVDRLEGVGERGGRLGEQPLGVLLELVVDGVEHLLRAAEAAWRVGVEGDEGDEGDEGGVEGGCGGWVVGVWADHVRRRRRGHTTQHGAVG